MKKKLDYTHRVVSQVFILILLTFNSTICFASQAADAPQITLTDLAQNHNHIFIGTVINKTIAKDRTHYIFNVSEYLKHPLNSSIILLTCGGGSEQAVSPSITFSLGIEYVMFSDEVDEDYRITGYHYSYRLLNSLESSDIHSILEVVKITDVSDIAQDDLAYEKAFKDYSEAQQILFNLALLLTAIIIFVLYIRFIRK